MGQYQCPDGWTDKSGSPACAGAVSAACTTAACCDISTDPTPAPTPAPAPTCATYSVAWAISQALGGGCAADTQFFDLKKLANGVASPQSDSDIKAACCTAFADATCADWVTWSCSSGQARVDANSAPGGGADGMTMTQDDFSSQCCETTPAPTPAPTTCASFSVAWILSQALGAGCAADTEFFDLKKLAVTVSSSADADVKSACCTPFSEAVCSDWSAMSCQSGQYVVGTNAAPADDGMTIEVATFRSSCCSDPISCADYAEDVSSAPRGSASIAAASVAVAVTMWA